MESNVRATSAAINSLVRRGDDALSAEDWDGAIEYYGRALEASTHNPALYLRLFLANKHLLNVDELRGVATQIIAETPAERTDLADVVVGEATVGQPVDTQVAELLGVELPAPGEAGDAEGNAGLEEATLEDSGEDGTSSAAGASLPKGAVHKASQAKRAQSNIHASYPQRLGNLRLSQEAFERTFEDDYWQAAYEQGGLEQRRHMERARADADEVFDKAFAEERNLLKAMCERAKVRIPRIRHITSSAIQSCDEALINFADASGARRQEVSQEFSYLGNNLRTAHASLWVGIALIVVGLVLLALAVIPRGVSVQNIAFAAFPEYFVPLGIVVVLVGVVLLVLRALLVRSNRETMNERQATAGVAKTSIVQDSDLLNTKVAAVRSRCHSLEALPLDTSDEAFEEACADLDATVKALGK